MKIYNKILLGACICAVCLTVLYYIALAVIPSTIDINKYAKTFYSDIEKQTGFNISSEQVSFKRSLSPFLKVHLYHTAVRYPDGSIFLQMKETDLQVKILPLLVKKIIIKDAKITRPIINITLYKDFTTSLEKYSNTVKAINTRGFELNGIINDLICSKYKIKFNDETINKTFYLEGEELILKDLKLKDKAHILIKGSVFEGKKEYINYDIDLISSFNSNIHKFSFSPFKTIKESDVKGRISGHLKADKENILGDLKIENLSLKLKDIVSTNNSADIVFKGQNAEINAVLHTSKTDIAEIKGKYDFGINRHIDLSTKAKNVSLENLFKIVSSITKILNIENPLNDISASGMLNAGFDLSSDFKKLKSKGKAEITDGVIHHKQLPYPISDINANINFNNNNIVIEQAVAIINKTPFQVEGKINEELDADLKAHSDNLDLKTLASAFLKPEKLPVTITKGNLSFVTEIKGNLGKESESISKIHINELSVTEKKNKVPVNAAGADISLNTKGNSYSGSIILENISSIVNKIPFKADKYTVSFDEKNIKIPQNTIFMYSSPVIINGEIKDYNNNPVINLDFNGNINSKELANILKQYIQAPYKAEGKLQTTGKITVNGDKQSIKSQIKADENNYISYMVIKELLKKPSVVNIDCEINKNNLSVNEISLKDNSQTSKNKIINVTGNILLNEDPEFKDIKINIPSPISGATGFFGGEELSFKTDIILNKTLKNPEIKGSAKIIKYNIKKHLTSIQNADVSFGNDNIRIIAPDVKINDSLFNIIADIEPAAINAQNINISNMQINSLNLDMNNLFPMLYTNRELFEKSVLNIKKGSATINNFKMLDLKASDISSDFQAEKNVIKLNNINANAYTGNITGKADYDLYSGLLNLNVSGKNIDIKNSLYDLCKLEDNLSGKTDFNANVSMMTGDYNTVIKSLNGNLQFSAKNGGMGTLGKFEYYLYAKNLFYNGLLNATINKIANALNHDKTEQFKTAVGNLIIHNGYIISEGIQTTGAKMSLYIRGKHNILTNQSNLDIFGRISDEITKKIGSFGDVSLSEIFNGQKSKKYNALTVIPVNIAEKIPALYNENEKSNTFKVNILGSIWEMSSINSFEWISQTENIYNNNDDEKEEENLIQEKEPVPAKIQEEIQPVQTEPLPDFSDLSPNI